MTSKQSKNSSADKKTKGPKLAKKEEDYIQIPEGKQPENQDLFAVDDIKPETAPETTPETPVVKKTKSKYNNLKHKPYTDFLMSSLNLETFDKNFTYEMHYLCRPNPKLYVSEQYGTKSYYCKPVCAIFKTISKEKN
jgi:hypothetical protein